MKVITLAAGKGGVGKTLLTASLAVLAMQECEAEGDDKVGVMDLDPQGSLAHWYNMRPSGRLQYVRGSLRIIREAGAMPRLSGFRYLFVDTPPGHSDFIRMAMVMADLVVVPIKPGELDMAATAKTIRQAQDRRRRFAVVPNGATYRSRAMGETIRHLRDANVPMLTPVHHRVGLMLRAGKTLIETDPTSRGAEELTQLWAGIKSGLEN